MTAISPVIISTPDENSSDISKWNATIEDLGVAIREKGHLVAIPTETVYGLGANALDRNSVLKIFEAKARPLSDPVICHVADAERLYDCSRSELAVIRILADAFWPGPLSLVARAANSVPPEVTASTGFVAVRCPRNSIALALIRAAHVPIAAPSANRFGRISPSCAAHVVKNFQNLTLAVPAGQTSLAILDGGPCEVGIESTVCKIDTNLSVKSPHLVLTILRRGAVSYEMISKVITAHLPVLQEELSPDDFALVYRSEVGISDSIKFELATSEISKPEKICSPGMLLSHYAPSVPTFLLCQSTSEDDGEDLVFFVGCSVDGISQLSISSCVIIDALGLFKHLENIAAAYLVLSVGAANNDSDSETNDADAEQMQRNVFERLHAAEDIAVVLNAKAILIADFRKRGVWGGEPALAVYDRIFRCVNCI